MRAATRFSHRQRHRAESIRVQRLEMNRRNAAAARDAERDELAQHVVAAAAERGRQADAVRLICVRARTSAMPELTASCSEPNACVVALGDRAAPRASSPSSFFSCSMPIGRLHDRSSGSCSRARDTLRTRCPFACGATRSETLAACDRSCRARSAMSRVVGRQHPAFTGRNRLARMEAEAGDVAGRADRPAVIGRPDRAGRVLDNRECPGRQRVSARRDRQPARPDEPGRSPSCAASRASRRPRGSMFQVSRLDVGEDRRRAGVEHGVGGRDERVRRADDFVAGADAARHERQVERRRARRGRDGVARADALGEQLLELRRPSAPG